MKRRTENSQSFYPAIGDRIYLARCKARISQRKLGERVGVTHAAISNAEKALAHLDLDKLAAIAAALGVPLTDLVVLERQADG